MIDYTILPGLNASLNGLSGVFLVLGYLAIRNGRARLHRGLMLSAFTSSTLFLISYLTYHFEVQFTPFKGEGVARMVYFAILIPHVILAVVMVPMVLVTLHRGLKGRFDKHRPLARWTLPIWLYVSVTGVLVYLMLYVWYPNG
ncbi:MAG: DUF420 domain-containing protein [SAR324 cluster bacterium]|nr:DUF420 domain-containing protein [SAR324 cluster bacterium]